MRWLHVLACTGMLSHHLFELAPGVGLVWQPQLGLAGAALGWLAVFAGWIVLASATGPVADALLALMAGFGIIGAAVHFTMWPVVFRGPLPWLTEAEGLPGRLIPAYNLLLYAWLAVSVAALALDVGGLRRLYALLPLAAVQPLRASARHHFHWIRTQAVKNPAWWNRAFAGGQ